MRPASRHPLERLHRPLLLIALLSAATACDGALTEGSRATAAIDGGAADLGMARDLAGPDQRQPTAADFGSLAEQGHPTDSADSAGSDLAADAAQDSGVIHDGGAVQDSAAGSAVDSVVAADLTCRASCTGKVCGADDGCGGVCATGSCPSGKVCLGGTCQGTVAAPSELKCNSLIAGNGFVGPMPSWLDARANFGAKGDGTSDDTAALQAAFNALAAASGATRTLYIPAGRYKISASLHLPYSFGLSIIGEDPRTTAIIYAGASGGDIITSEAWYSKITRLELDGRQQAGAAIRNPGNYFATFLQFSDLFIHDTSRGIVLSDAPTHRGVAETSIARVYFKDVSDACVITNAWNTLDIWITHGRFENCGTGVRNYTGNYHVYDSVFLGSRAADIDIYNSMNFSFRGNISLNAQRFIAKGAGGGSGAPTVLQNNTILGIKDPHAIRWQSLGGLTLLDNVIETSGAPIEPNADSQIVSWGNTYTHSTTALGVSVLAGEDQLVARGSIPTPSVPAWTPEPKIAAPIFEVSQRDAAGIQAAIDAAINSNQPLATVHLLAGDYNVARPLLIPAGANIQILGEGPSTNLMCNGCAKIFDIRAPSFVTVGELSASGFGVGDAVVISGSDTPNSYIQGDQLWVTDNTNGLIVDGLNHAKVDLVNFGHTNNRPGVSIEVRGGPLVEAGSGSARTVIYSGHSSGHYQNGYNVEHGGKLLARDIWLEDTKVAARSLSGKGTLTFDGFWGAHYYDASVPLINVDGFRGDLLLIGAAMIMHDPQHNTKLRVRGDAGDARVGIIGSMFDLDVVDAPSNLDVRILSSVQQQQAGSAASRYPDRGSADGSWISSILAFDRSVASLPVIATNCDSNVKLKRLLPRLAPHGVLIRP